MKTRNVKFLLLLLTFASIVVIIITNKSSYSTLALLPVTYFTTFLCFGLNNRNNNSFTFWTIILMSFLRYVIIPLLESLTGSLELTTRLYSSSSANWASILMSYELIIVWLFYLLFSNTKQLRCSIDEIAVYKEHFRLIGDKRLYSVYIMISITLFILLGSKYGAKVNFILIESGTNMRIGDNESTIASLLTMLLNTGISFLFLVLLDICKPKNENNSGKFWLAMISGLIPILIIVGERRTSVLYNAFVTAFMLSIVFSHKRRTIIRMIIYVSLGILFLMTVYKVLNAFLYASYVDALINSTFGLIDFAGQLDAYYAGPVSVMMNLTFAESYGGNGIITFLFDLGRSLFGLSYLLKGKGKLLSELYNYQIYSGNLVTGYLLTSVGYGTIIIGKVFGPFFGVLRLIAAMLFERWMIRAKSYEYTYLFAFCFISNAFFFYGSIISQLSSLSRMIIIYSVIILCASLLRKRLAST